MFNQIILPIKNKNTTYTQEFIISDSNKEAYKTIKNHKEFGLMPYPNSLFLIGPKYSGKTMLAHIFISLTNGKILKTKDLKDPLKIIELVNYYDSFVIEDVNPRSNQINLLHAFNIIAEHKKKLLLTAIKIPKFQLPDLLSRINSLQITKLMQADQKLLKIIIFKKFSNLSININNNMVDFLIESMPNNIKFILSFIDKLNKFTLINKKKITKKLIKELLYSKLS